MGVTNGEGNVIRVVKFVVFMVIVCLYSFYQSVVFFIMFCETLLASLTFFYQAWYCLSSELWNPINTSFVSPKFS
jgi:hypothetical protein